MKEKLLYGVHLFLPIIIIYPIIDISIYLHKYFTGALVGDPVGTPLSFIFLLFLLVLLFVVLIAEYNILVKKNTTISFIITIILGGISLSVLLNSFFILLGLIGVLIPTEGDTIQNLFLSILSCLVCFIFSIAHYFTYRKNIKNRHTKEDGGV